MEYVFWALLGAGFVFLGPIAFFMTLGARTRLDYAERKIKALEVRLADVETAGPGPTGRAEPSAIQPQDPQRPQETQEPQSPTIAVVETPAPQAESETSAAQPAAGAPDEAQTSVPLPGGALPPEQSPHAGSPSQPAEPQAAAPLPRPGLEELLGARWAVWVGGLALAIGALLLVRQAIFQGWFGPGARILMGLVLSAALIAAGEYLRRREKDFGDQTQSPDKFSFESPSIPAILTAAGTVAAFGTVYAAHALYGFIGSSFAFVALGAIGVATMFAAALHGPMLAGIGLAGAFVGPLLISSRTPTPWPVLIYLLVVALSAYGLARLRLWLWLALAAGVGAAVWLVIFLNVADRASDANFYQAALLHLNLHMAMALFVFCYEPWRGVNENDSKTDPLASFIALAAGVLAAIALVSGAQDYFGGAWIAAAAGAAIMLAASGYLSLPAIAGVGVSGALILASALFWKSASNSAGLSLGHAFDEMTIFPPLAPTQFSIFALVLSLALLATCAWRVLRGGQLALRFVAIYSAAAVLTPALALIVAYVRFTGGATSTLFGSLAAGLALAFATLAHIFRNGVREGEPAAWTLALGIYASAAIGTLALAFVMVLDGGVLTVALALAALGAAFVSVRLDIPALRWCVTGFGVAVAARYLWEPRIVSDIGTTPIFNWLLVGYGVPALAFGYAARMMRLARGEDAPVRVGEALAIMCSALLTFFEIRHFINGGDPYAANSRLIETGLFAIASMMFALVLMRLDLRRHSPVMNAASYIFGVGSTAISAFGLGMISNPYFLVTRQTVEGGVFFNALLLAYFLPGVIAAFIGRMADGVRPRWYVMMMRILAVALIFGYLTLQVRRVFQGPAIDLMRRTSDGEWYAYSLVWLAFGIALLAYGLWRRSVEVRIASALFIVLSVVKVFVFDLRGLEGVLRALSFIGLGLVLIGIGLVYQKFVFVRRAPPQEPPQSEPPQAEPLAPGPAA